MEGWGGDILFWELDSRIFAILIIPTGKRNDRWTKIVKLLLPLQSFADQE